MYFYNPEYDYFTETTLEKCDIFADLFVLSVERGLASISFVTELMTNPVYKFWVTTDESQEWCDEYFLLQVFENIKPFKKGGVANSFDMWFMGYTYKYWMRTRKMSPKRIFKILPVEWFLARMGKYHTEDYDYVIDDAIKYRKIDKYAVERACKGID